ncbi:Uncharacterized protein SCF082_LOCUS19039 [Durusdinium trenchii]|uniref:Uncharacterized protein n=1 Tax=Durusdinium trenchii TaxID=1381693 RepID=A0ABP0KSW8_9DINO
MNNLTRNLLNFNASTDYPTGSWVKGADTAAAARYLEHKYSGVIEDHPNHERIHYLKAIHSALSGLNKFFHNLYNAHLWMRRPEAKHTAQRGRAVLKNYLRARL